MIGFDEYYSRPEVSNSDLSALKNYFMPKEYQVDVTQAYRFGNLIDAMITERHRCDFYSMKVDDERFTVKEWDQALAMRSAFEKDPFCQQLLQIIKGQAVKTKQVDLLHNGIPFSLPMRCKYDLWSDPLAWGGDIKSTTATSQRQFEQACEYFDYDRQRAVYMTISGAEKDVLIGISKVNFKIFKIHITRQSDFFLSGMQKFQELAFMYWKLFGELTNQQP